MARYIGDKEVADFLIKEEGFLDKPTDIGDGKITLGSGLTDPKWHALYKKKGRWSKEDNRNAVLEEVAKRRVWAEDTIPNWEYLPESAQDALLSYKYNYNFTPTNSPNFFEAMREGNFLKAAEEMNATSKDPKFKKGLEERRKREQEMFLSDLMPQKAPSYNLEIPYNSEIVSDNTRVSRYPVREERSQVKTIIPDKSYIETASISPGEQKAQELRNTFESTRDYNRMMDAISIQNNPAPQYQFPMKFGRGGRKKPVTTGGAGYVPALPSIAPLNLPSSMQDARLRFYNQVSPAWGFTDDTIKAAANTLLHNKNAWSEHPEEVIVDDPYVDTVWAEYLQIPKEQRRHNYQLQQSKTRPTVGDNSDITYYTIPINQEAKDQLVHEAELLPVGKNKVSDTLMGYNHGEHTVGKGIDSKKGQYVSYYDRWDLNPLSSRYSSETKLRKNPILKKLGLMDNRKYGDLSFGIGKPIEFYDRIYLDDYYGVDSSAEPGTYYGGYLPEWEISNPTGTNILNVRVGNDVRFGVPNKKEEGGQLEKLKLWNNLSLKEKSEMMRVAIENGITTLPEIKEAYNEFAKGGYVPSASIKKKIEGYEGKAMTGARDPLSGKWSKNNSFEAEAKGFYNALPADIREEVLSNPELADNLYSYSYNVGAGNFKKRVVPALKRYYSGTGSAREIANSMWASGDAKLRGLRRRRADEKAGVLSALGVGEIAPLQTSQTFPTEEIYDFELSNPEAFFAPVNYYQRPVIVEEPLVQAAIDNAYSKEQLERDERRQGLNTLNWLLGMTSPQGSNDSFVNTIGMLAGNS